MAILVKMDEVKKNRKVKNKFELNKIISVFIFILILFILKVLFEILGISNFFGDFGDIILILLSFFFTYIYLKKKYLVKEHKEKGFIRISKKNKEDYNIVPRGVLDLNDGNYILQNINFKINNRINHINLMVINNNGVFIIHNKKDEGELLGVEEDYKWNLNLNGKVKSIDNPIIEIKKEKEKIDNYLKGKGYNITVREIIYYEKENIDLKIKYREENFSIFKKTTEEELVNYIRKFKAFKKIDFEDVLEIILNMI